MVYHEGIIQFTAKLSSSISVLENLRNPQLSRQKNARSQGEIQEDFLSCWENRGNPKLLLLDEPSIGLAPIVVREIGKVALKISKDGTSIVLVEQNARLALRLARKGYVSETETIVLEGDTGSLLHNEEVLRACLGWQKAPDKMENGECNACGSCN